MQEQFCVDFGHLQHSSWQGSDFRHLLHNLSLVAARRADWAGNFRWWKTGGFIQIASCDDDISGAESKPPILGAQTRNNFQAFELRSNTNIYTFLIFGNVLQCEFCILNILSLCLFKITLYRNCCSESWVNWSWWLESIYGPYYCALADMVHTAS